MVKTCDDLSSFNAEINKPCLTVCDYFADWCGPCQMIGPFVAELSSKYPDVNFIKVNVDNNQEVAQQQAISAMPTFQFFVSGNKIDEFRGADKNQLESKVKEHQSKGASLLYSGEGHTLNDGGKCASNETLLEGTVSIDTVAIDVTHPSYEFQGFSSTNKVEPC